LATSLFTTLKGLKGNARGVVFTEALWGIPFNLYAPYVSVYMLALGLDDQKIGMIASLGLVGQILSALLGGAITDKFRAHHLIADLFRGACPAPPGHLAIYFVIAALINSTWRVSMVSWAACWPKTPTRKSW
jgi:MFS family permease